MKNQRPSKTLTPKLRFPEFRDEWRESLLGTVVKEFQKESTTQDEHEVLTSARVGLMRQVDYYGAGRITERDNVGFNIVPADYLTYRSRTDDGRFCFNHNDLGITGIISVYYPVFHSIDGSNAFLATLLNRYSAEIGTHSVGTSQRVLPLSKLLRIRLPIPRPAEQRKIAACLTSVDELLAAERRKLEALAAHKQGLMQQLFPRPGESRPRLRFPAFRDAGEWKILPLSTFISTLDAGVSVNAGDRPAGANEIGVLKTSCVTDGLFDPTENKVVLDAEELDRVREPVTADTILISRMNTVSLVGANAYVERGIPNIFVPDRLWAAKPTDRAHFRFIAYILGSNRGRRALSLAARGTSGSMKNISKADVLELTVAAPETAEQQRIAACLRSLDVLIAAQSRKLDDLRAHKKGLMQQLFPSPEGE